MADTSLFRVAVAEMPLEGLHSQEDAAQESVRPEQTEVLPDATVATIMEPKPQEWDGLEQERRQMRLAKMRSGVARQEEASAMQVPRPGLAGRA